MQPASVSEIARLSASCDGDCISGDIGHHDTGGLSRLEDDTGSHEQDRLEVEDVENEFPVGVQSSTEGENSFELKDQNGAASNDSNSPLKPDIENELKYGQDRPAGTILANDNNNDADDDDDADDKQEDGEKGAEEEEGKEEISENELKYGQDRPAGNILTNDEDEDEDGNGEKQEDGGKGAEEEEKDKEVLVVVERGQNDEEKELDKQVREQEEKPEENAEDDASSINSFHYRPTNTTAAAAAANDKPSSTTTTTNSAVSDAEDDVVEKYDFDKNAFIVQAANHPTNATETSAGSDMLDENNVPMLPVSGDTEITEIEDHPLPIPPDDDEINNLIRQHTENAGK